MAALMRLHCSKTMAEREKHKLDEIMHKPLLVNSATTTVASVVEAKYEKAFAQRLQTKSLGIVARRDGGQAEKQTDGANTEEAASSSATTSASGSGTTKSTPALVSADYLSTSDSDS